MDGMSAVSGGGREQAWDVTTSHGTRILLDPGEESRWTTIPAISEDGRVNLHVLDGRWRQLLTAYPWTRTTARAVASSV